MADDTDTTSLDDVAARIAASMGAAKQPVQVVLPAEKQPKPKQIPTGQVLPAGEPLPDAADQMREYKFAKPKPGSRVGAGGDKDLDVDPSTGKERPELERPGGPSAPSAQAEDNKDTATGTRAPMPSGSGAEFRTGTTPPAEGEATGAPKDQHVTVSMLAPKTGEEGRSQLDTVLGGVFWTESRNRQFDPATGRVVTSPTGALGKGQVLPSTARDTDPTLDPRKEADNEKLSRMYLEQMYDKYGNWPDALVAYNAGPGSADRWIKQGRPYRFSYVQYVNSVLNHAGIKDQGMYASDPRKRQPDDNDAERIARSLTDRPEVSHDTTAPDVKEEDLDITTGIPLSWETGQATEAIGAFSVSGLQAMRDLVAGPLQALLEQTSPENAAKLTSYINGMDESVKGLTDKHNIAAGLGYATGTAVGMMGQIGALSMPVSTAMARLTPAFAGRLGLITGGALVGTESGLTTYNPNPDEQSRLVEGVVGAGVGAFTGGLAKGAFVGAKRIADTKTWQSFMETLKTASGDLVESTKPASDALMSHYRQMTEQANARFEEVGAAGREFAGFPAEVLGKPAQDALADIRMRGKAPTGTTKAVASDVLKEMGGPEYAQAQAKYTRELQQYDKDIAQWEKDTGGLGADNPAVRAQIERQFPRPERPVFEPPPVTGAQYRSGLDKIAQARAVTTDPVTRGQLDVMTRGIKDAARETAASVGIRDADTFIAKADAANDFFRQEIGPIRDFLGKDLKVPRGGRTLSGMTGTEARPPALTFDEVFDKMSGLLDGKVRDGQGRQDFTKVARMIRAMGPNGQQMVESIGAYKLFTSLSRNKSPHAALDGWIKDHEKTIEQVAGPGVLQELKGMAKVGEAILTNEEKHGKLYHMLTGHSWLQTIGVAETFMGAVERQPGRMISGVGMIGMPWAGHALYGVYSALKKVPGADSVIRRVANTRTGSPEQERAIAELTRRAAAYAATGGRLAGAAAGQSRLGGAVGQAPGAVGSAAMSIMGFQ